MKFKPVLDMCEEHIKHTNKVVDWSDLRDMVDVETGSDLPPSKLDTLTQQLVNRLHKNASYLLKTE